MKPDTYSVTILWSEEDKVFIATVAELPGCMAHGETRGQAIHEIEIAIQNWTEPAREFGGPIPSPRGFAH